ncbi:GNAT family N-acetyltransferase [Umezawaea beigongshangensis]|uniref:GNAT family N-acetyltransferase n=1 Tax=Umezawaea beigongshangensis TaxID=2780383 RepID=UPI0018F1B654|nr:GNAT family N-acetyltransferase [Umezawaea beigongshangensis]
MITDLDPSDDATASAVRTIGLRACAVEAALIGSTAVPALSESLAQMRAQPVRWLGAHVDGRLAAFLARSDLGDGTIDVERLCADPAHFRRGLASRLLERVVDEGRDVLVSTGAANLPALALYARFGFVLVRHVEPEPGVRLALLRLTAQKSSR